MFIKLKKIVEEISPARPLPSTFLSVDIIRRLRSILANMMDADLLFIDSYR
jgi:hypothetical protein